MSFLLNHSYTSYKGYPFNCRKLVILSRNFSILHGGKYQSRKATVSSSHEVIDPSRRDYRHNTTSPVRKNGKRHNLMDFWDMCSISKVVHTSTKLFKCKLGSSWALPQKVPLFAAY